MPAVHVLYGVVIKDAIASKDLKKMKATAEKAKQYIRDQKDVSVALLDLLDAIDKLEKK
jgi:hypothetical protein